MLELPTLHIPNGVQAVCTCVHTALLRSIKWARWDNVVDLIGKDLSFKRLLVLAESGTMTHVVSSYSWDIILEGVNCICIVIYRVCEANISGSSLPISVPCKDGRPPGAPSNQRRQPADKSVSGSIAKEECKLTVAA